MSLVNDPNGLNRTDPFLLPSLWATQNWIQGTFIKVEYSPTLETEYENKNSVCGHLPNQTERSTRAEMANALL